jgi:hypothetical protein
MSNFMQKLVSFGQRFMSGYVVMTRWETLAERIQSCGQSLATLSTIEKDLLRAMPGQGDQDHRRRLRQRFFDATGLVNASFYVMVASITDF